MTKKQKVYLKLAQAVEKGLEKGLELIRRDFGDGVTCGCPLTMIGRTVSGYRPYSGPKYARKALGITTEQAYKIVRGFDGYPVECVDPYCEIGQYLRETYYETA